MNQMAKLKEWLKLPDPDRFGSFVHGHDRPIIIGENNQRQLPQPWLKYALTGTVKGSAVTKGNNCFFHGYSLWIT
jgi:hypothetical protein